MNDDLQKHIEHKKKIAGLKGLSVRSANALFRSGFSSKDEVVKFIEQGGDLKAINDVGIKADKEICKWFGL